MTMRSKLRRAKIAEMVEARGEASVDEIAAMFDASHETIRRDLAALEETGALLKVHGGAKRAPRAEEGPFDERMARNRAGKQIIAEKLARWMAPDQTVFVDTGSTTLIAAEALRSVRGLRLLTNSLRIASRVVSGSGEAEVFLLGGRLDRDNGETVGPTTIEEIGRFNADVAVITIGALHAAEGASDFSFDEAQVARAMIARAKKTALVADGSKFDQSAPFRVCALEEVDLLITDAPPGAALSAALDAAKVRVL